MLLRYVHRTHTRLQDGDATGMLAELLTGFAAPVPDILDTLGPDRAVHVAPIEEVRLDGWSRRSVLLIGDAAHATSPNMAEGAAMALEDGLVLAECLASEVDVAQAIADSKLVAAPARNGCSPRRTAGIAPATFRPPSATWCCVDGEGTFSTPTTGRFSISLTLPFFVVLCFTSLIRQIDRESTKMTKKKKKKKNH